VYKIEENRLRWFGRVMKRGDSEAGRTVMELRVKGRRGRPKKKWSNAIECDTRTAGVWVDGVRD